jgi:hypothetical protein
MVFGVLVQIVAALATCMFGRLLCQASIRSFLPGEPDCGVAGIMGYFPIIFLCLNNHELYFPHYLLRELGVRTTPLNWK